MTRGFTILDHPSDLGIRASGGTLSEAFEEAAKGMMSVVVDPETVEAREERSLSLEAGDPSHLLVKWLAEILYLYDGRQFVCRVFEIGSMTGASLKATVRGEDLDPQRHRTRIDVKAVTYHQIAVREESGGAVVTVFLDI